MSKFEGVLTFFKNNQITGVFWLLIYGIAIKSALFASSAALLVADDNVISLSGLLGGEVSPWLMASMVIFVSILQAIMLTNLSNLYKLDHREHFLVGMTYLLLTSLSPQMMSLSGALLANTFLIAALHLIMQVYKGSNTLKVLYNVGLVLGIACLFEGSYWVYYLFFSIGISMFTSFDIRKLLVLLSGGATVLLWLFAYRYLIDTPEASFWSYFIFSYPGIPSGVDWRIWAYLGILLVLLIWVSMSYAGNFFRKGIREKKSISLLYLMLPFGVLLFFSMPGYDMSSLLSLVIPLSILFSFYFANAKRIFWAEAVHLLLFSSIMVLNFYHLF